MGFGKSVKFNQWRTIRGVRVFLYDTYNTKHNPSVDVQQCRGEYKTDTHQVIFNYNINDWIDEYYAPIQLKKWLYQKYGIARSLCTAEIIKSVGERRVTRIQWVWLSKDEPSQEMMMDIQERVLQLPKTARTQKKDLNCYHRQLFEISYEDEPDEDKKEYVMNTREIIEDIENGII